MAGYSFVGSILRLLVYSTAFTAHRGTLNPTPIMLSIRCISFLKTWSENLGNCSLYFRAAAKGVWACLFFDMLNEITQDFEMTSFDNWSYWFFSVGCDFCLQLFFSREV